MAKPKKEKMPVLKKTALMRLSDTTVFIAFDDKEINGTITKADGTTCKFSDTLKEVK